MIIYFDFCIDVNVFVLHFFVVVVCIIKVAEDFNVQNAISLPLYKTNWFSYCVTSLDLQAATTEEKKIFFLRFIYEKRTIERKKKILV